MKIITLKNSDGETIEVEYTPDGAIRIRHSDIDPKAFGEFHEFSKRLRQAGPRSLAQSKGVDPSSPEVKAMAERLGGYMVLRGETYTINAEETALILEAIKQDGGVVPNWSNRP